MLSVKRAEDLCSPAKKAKLEPEAKADSAEDQIEPKPELQESIEGGNGFIKPKIEEDEEDDDKDDKDVVAKLEEPGLKCEEGETINMDLLDALMKESVRKKKSEKKEIISMDDVDVGEVITKIHIFVFILLPKSSLHYIPTF